MIKDATQPYRHITSVSYNFWFIARAEFNVARIISSAEVKQLSFNNGVGSLFKWISFYFLDCEVGIPWPRWAEHFCNYNSAGRTRTRLRRKLSKASKHVVRCDNQTRRKAGVIHFGWKAGKTGNATNSQILRKLLPSDCLNNLSRNDAGKKSCELQDTHFSY